MSRPAKAKLVPITREFLAAFYSQHPLSPVPDEAALFIKQVDQMSKLVGRKGSTVPSTVDMDTPTRIDDCFWRNRQLCEDIADRLGRLPQAVFGANAAPPVLEQAVQASSKQLTAGEASLLKVQNENTDTVATMVRQFLPTGIRGQLLEAQRHRTERAYAKAIEALARKGGTIREKYDLYLKQQWERREALAALANCSGMYKLLIKYLGGIPDELMDFAKEINAKLGPMEEQRLAYGPDLYVVTELGIKLNVVLALWLENPKVVSCEDASLHLQQVVLPAADIYVKEVVRIVQHIGKVFHISPFFITLEEANAAAATATEQQPHGGTGRGSLGRTSTGPRSRSSHAGSIGEVDESLTVDSASCQAPSEDGHHAKEVHTQQPHEPHHSPRKHHHQHAHPVDLDACTVGGSSTASATLVTPLAQISATAGEYADNLAHVFNAGLATCFKSDDTDSERGVQIK